VPVFRYLSRTFYSLENQQFRILWFGTLFSFLGMQMQVIARGYLAFTLTGTNSALGGVMLAFGVPQLLLGLWGGVIADRLPKRKTLLVMQTVVATNSAWVATMIEFDMVAYWMLIVASAVQGAAFAFIGPARQAFISDLVGRQSIGNAVVLQQLSMNSTRVIGPAVAGALIAIPLIGVAGVYYLTTAGFVIATITMMRLPAGDPAPGASDRSPLLDLRDGLSYVRARPAVAILILSSFSIVMVGFPYQSFLPSIALDLYNVDAGGLGLLSTTAAIGAVGSTIVVATIAGHRRAWQYQPLAAVAFGSSLLLLGLSPNFYTGLAVMLFVGALAAAFQSLNNALTMMMTDHEYHGRVQSITMLSWSFFGLAALPIGIIADHIGLRETLALQGLICILAIIALQTAGRAFHVSASRLPPLRDASREARAGGGGS
jgi:MFS family permease